MQHWNKHRGKSGISHFFISTHKERCHQFIPHPWIIIGRFNVWIIFRCLINCRKICLVGVLIRSILRGKMHERFSASALFSAKSNELTHQHDMICFNHASIFLRTTTSWKVLNNKIKSQTKTGNKSRALNMSCRFDQSARSIESRSVVNGRYVL